MPATANTPRILRADHVQLNGEAPGLPFVANGVKRSGWLVLTDQGEFRFYDKELPAMTKAPALSAAAVDQFVRKVTAVGVLVRFGKDRYNMGFTGELGPSVPGARSDADERPAPGPRSDAEGQPVSRPQSVPGAHSAPGVRSAPGERPVPGGRPVPGARPVPEWRSAEGQEKIGEGGDLVSSVGSLIADGGAAGVGQSISVAGDLASLAVDTVQLYRMARNRKRRAAAKAAWYPVLRGTRPWYLINEAERSAPAS
ncbi:MAG TPA: hypothetical protein VMU95_35890 [Trebonia sp.]|nr:hypothetical protein [Trebonia sp.]